MSEYADDLKIDFAELDINWRDHSANYIKWAEKWVNAVAQRDQKKEELEVLKADLDKKYRVELEKKLGKKPTEAIVSAAIISDETHQTVQYDLIEANKEVNILAVIKTAFEHRRQALEGSTKLWISGYNANPSIPFKFQEQLEQNTQEMRDVQIEKLNANSRLKKRKLIKKKK